MKGHNNTWFIINKTDEVAKVPYWLVLLMAGHRDPSSYYGPYIFYNNFESEPAAKYLKEMFKYRVLTPTAETKVRSLLQQYKLLVGIDTEFIQVLIEREGCPNYWTEVEDD